MSVCARPQVCACVHSKKGLTGQTTFDLASYPEEKKMVQNISTAYIIYNYIYINNYYLIIYNYYSVYIHYI